MCEQTAVVLLLPYANSAWIYRRTLHFSSRWWTKELLTKAKLTFTMGWCRCVSGICPRFSVAVDQIWVFDTPIYKKNTFPKEETFFLK